MIQANSTATLSLKEIKEVLKERFKYQVENPKKPLRPLFLQGHAGIGKTRIVAQAVRELSHELKQEVALQILTLQFCERPDFMGLPFVDSTGRTSYARPRFLPDQGFGILFLDEANRVESDIRSAMLTLLEDREINGHRLGDSWMIILAGNPPQRGDSEGGYEVQEFDLALVDRLARVEVVPTVPELQVHLNALFSGHPLLRVLECFPDFISFSGKGCTPRTFEYALRATAHITDIRDPHFRTILQIELGTNAAAQLLKILEMGYVPTLKNFLEKDPRAVRFLQANSHRTDITVHLVGQIFDWIAVCSKDGRVPTPQEISGLIDLILEFKHESRVSLFERVRGSPHSTFFGQYFLKNTRLGEVLFAKRAAAA